MRRGYDEDSQTVFDKWKNELVKYESVNELLGHNIIKEFLAGLDIEILFLEKQLKTHREFDSDIEKDRRLRNYIFDKIELYKRFVSLFKVEDKVKKINEEIKKYG